MPRCRAALVFQGTILALVVVCVGLIAWHVPIGPTLRALEDRFQSMGPWGLVAFGLVYVLAVLILGPVSLLTMAAGALYGLLGGTIVASLAWTLGAAVAFLGARFLARERVQQRVRRSARWSAYEQAINQGSWRLVVLLRLSPWIVNLQNYLFGLTQIPFRTFVLCQWLASLPVTFLYVALGHYGRAGLAAAPPNQGPLEAAKVALGLLVVLVALGYVTHLARRRL